MENENFNSIPLLYMLGRLHQSEDGGRLLHPLQTALQSWMAPKLSLQFVSVVSVAAEDPVVGGCEQDYYLALATNVHAVGGWPPEFVVMYVAIASHRRRHPLNFWG